MFTRWLLFLAALLAAVIAPAQADSLFQLLVGQAGPQAGVYDFIPKGDSPDCLTICLAPNGDGSFKVAGTYDTPTSFEQVGNPAGTVTGKLTKAGILTATAGIGPGKTSSINGKWDTKRGTLVIVPNAGQGSFAGVRRGAVKVGLYGGRQNNEPRFNLVSSSKPNEYTIHGYYPKGWYALAISGTYYSLRNHFSAFGKYQFEDKLSTVTLSGRMMPSGEMRVLAKTTALNGDISNEWFEAPHIGPADPKLNEKSRLPSILGFFRGSVKATKPAVEIGEKNQVKLSYQLQDYSSLTATEEVTLIGPGGRVESTSKKERSATRYNPTETTFDITCAKDGVYRVKVKVSAEKAQTWETETSFSVKPLKTSAKPTTTTKPPTPSGTYNLVKKLVGKAAPPEDTGYGTRKSATVSEGSFTYSDTPTQPNIFTKLNCTMKWDNAPSTLKPGQILEFNVSAALEVSERDRLHTSIDVWFVFRGGFEVLEQKHAWVGTHGVGQVATSGTGKYRVKVPPAGGGELHIWQGQTGLGFGLGGNYYPCQYWYQWNAKPIATDPKPAPTEPDKPAPKPVVTSMVISSEPKEEFQIKARLEPSEITLYAGEPSQIVDIIISGFRTNTSDRVTVDFPQGTDMQISLPGQIVTSSGRGNLDPSNMNRPEHKDGYFFAARSTAPDSEQNIEIVVKQKGAGEVKLILHVRVQGRNVAAPIQTTVLPAMFAGTWKSSDDWNPLVLTVTGDKVKGTFAGGKAILVGMIEGEGLHFAFENFQGKSGTGVLGLTDDRKGLDGYANFANDDLTMWLKFGK